MSGREPTRRILRVDRVLHGSRPGSVFRWRWFLSSQRCDLAWLLPALLSCATAAYAALFAGGDGDGFDGQLESGLNVAGVDIDNAGGATGATSQAAWLNGTLVATDAATTVWLYWDTSDKGATSNWLYSTNLGVRDVGPLSVMVTGLLSNVTYYYRFYGTNAIGRDWAWPAARFHAASPPVVTNAGASAVAPDKAILNGALVQGGYANVTVYWGRNTNNWANTNVIGPTIQGTFSTNIGGLSVDTPYYYVCYATNAYGESWSQVRRWSYDLVRFKGGDGDGYDTVLETSLNVAGVDVDNANGATGVTDQAAWLNGTLVATDAVTTVWLYWDTSDKGATTNWQSSTNLGVRDIGPLSVMVTGLVSNVTYYYRFYGTNAIGRDWAWPAARFYAASPPVVTNAGASAVAPGSATLNGALVQGGYANVTVYWGRNTNNWANTNVIGPTIQGSFSTNISGLSVDTAYYYVCYATNAYGESWSQVKGWSYELTRFKGGYCDGYDAVLETSLNVAGVDIDNADGATGVTDQAAWLNGTLVATDAATTVWLYWDTSDKGATTNWLYSTNLGVRDVGSLSVMVTGLVSNVTYYYRFYGTNAIGRDWAWPAARFCAASPPVVTNAGASAVTPGSATLNGNLVQGGSADVTIYWGVSTNNWAHTNSLGLLMQGAFSTDVSGLGVDTVYYYVCRATNAYGVNWSQVGQWSYSMRRFACGAGDGHDALLESGLSIAGVDIDNARGATGVTSQTAWLNGTLVATDAVTTVWLYWDASDKGATTNWLYSTNLGVRDVGPLSVMVTGLVPGVTYYYRFAGTNDNGRAWAWPAERFQYAAAPVVTNTGASAVTSGSAMLNGILAGGGYADVTVYWGRNTNSWANTNSFGSIAQGEFSTNASGLGVDTEYYYLCYATNAYGESRSEVRQWSSCTTRFKGGDGDGYDGSFETGLNVASVDIDNAGGATGVTSQAAWLNGTLVATDAVTMVCVYWDTSDKGAVTNWLYSTNLGVRDIGPLSVMVTGLTPGLTYYYRFHGTNANGQDWAWPAASLVAADPVFTDPPVVVNTGAGAVTTNSATLGGTLSEGGSADVWIYWGQNTNNWANTNSLGWLPEGAFSTNIGVVSTDIVYYYICRATNAYGASWSQVRQWSYRTRGLGGDGDGYDGRLETGLNIASVDIDNAGGATGVTSQAAWLNGTLVATDAVTTVRLYWDTSDRGTTTNWLYSTNLGVRDIGPLSVMVTGLVPNVTYYYRFYGTNSNGHDWAWPAARFYLGVAPLVTNTGASAVAPGSATLNGTLLQGGYADVTVYWGPNTNSWANTNNLGLTIQGDFSTNISGLSVDTNYYYVYYATNANGESWSQIKPWSYGLTKFKGGDGDGCDGRLETGLNIASVDIDNAGGATGVTSQAAWLNGTLVATDAATTVWLYWDTSDKGATTNWLYSTNLGVRDVGSLGVMVTGLVPNVTYYYRFYGTNANGHDWAWPAAQFQFTAAPVVTNTGASAVSPGSAALNGALMQGGYANVTVYWGRNTNSWANTNVLGLLAQGAFSTNVSGLIVDTPYYYACYATNASGGSWSQVREWSYGLTKFKGGEGDGHDVAYETGLNVAGVDIDNAGGATGVSDQAAWLNGTLVATDAATTVWLYWDTADRGATTNWLYSTNLGVRDVGSMSVMVTGLAQGVTYYYRFYGTNANGHDWAWPAAQFKPAAAPVVTNTGASAVAPGSATLNGTLIQGGYADVTIYWGQNTNSWANTNSFGLIMQGGFSTNIGGLGVDTVYYYACYATNADGGSWSQVREWSYGLMKFKGGNGDGYDGLYETGLSVAGLDIDNAGGATGVTDQAAWLNGTLVATDAATTVWLYWDTADRGATTNWLYSTNLGVRDVGPLSVLVTGLVPNVTYYYRFYGTNDIGHDWAWPAARFYLGAAPVVTNTGASAVNDSSATLNGTLAQGGYADVTICWGQNTNSWANTNSLGSIMQGVFSVDISGQGADTVYYYACYATNAYGESRSAIRQWSSCTTRFKGGDGDGHDSLFETGLRIVNIEINNANGPTNVTTTNAWLNGNLARMGGTPTDVWIYWGATDGQTNKANWTTNIAIGIVDTGLFSQQAGGMLPGAPYFYRCYATNAYGESWAPSTFAFETLSPVIASNGLATAVTQSNATLGARLATGGFGELRVYWGLVDGNTNDASWPNTNSFGVVQAGSYSTSVAVRAGGRYYYRAYATNLLGDDWADATALFTSVVASVSINDISLVEGDSGEANATFLLTMSAPSAVDVAVTCTTSNGTASTGSDYISTNAVVTIPAGQSNATFSVRVTGDTLHDASNEVFYVNLSAPSNCTVADWQGVATIVEDDYMIDWRHSMKITFSGYTRPETLTNFPALVMFQGRIPDFSYSEMYSSIGGDLRFVNSNRTVILNHDIERWDIAGKSYVWVQVPELVSSNTYIWAYWGNPAGTNPPACTTNGATWSQAYTAVWHCAQGAGTAVSNARPAGVNGTLQNGSWDAASRVGCGLQVNNADPGVSVGALGFSSGAAARTISGWVKQSVPSAASRSIFGFSGGAGDNQFLDVEIDSGANWVIHTYGWDAAITVAKTNSEWYYISGTYDGNTVAAYMNGVQYVNSARGALSITDNFKMGDRGGWAGWLDEVRVSTVARSANWEWASWMTVASNSVFCKAVRIDSAGTVLLVR